MNCDNAIDLIQRHVDNDLSEPELLELNAHLSICPSCSIMLVRLQALSDQLLQLPKVTPKISIVDAILPKLLEMEAQVQLHEESASLAVETQHAPIREAVPGRRFFGYVSWKMTSAAAIAACAILFFILNQQDETQSHLASNIAVQDQAKMSAAPASETPAAATNDKGNNDLTITSSPIPEPTPATTASISTGNSVMETKDSTEVTALSNAGKAKTPVDSKNLQSNTASPKPQPSLTFTPEQTGSSVSEGSSNSVAVAPTTEPGTGGGITSLVSDSSTSIKKEDSNTYKRVSNEQFVAEVKDRRMVISSIATNTVVFASLRQWTEMDTVNPVGWTPEGKFYYEVTGKGAVRAFLVDVATRTELQIK